jgi:hypothetical protein
MASVVNRAQPSSIDFDGNGALEKGDGHDEPMTPLEIQ